MVLIVVCQKLACISLFCLKHAFLYLVFPAVSLQPLISCIPVFHLLLLFPWNWFLGNAHSCAKKKKNPSTANLCRPAIPLLISPAQLFLTVSITFSQLCSATFPISLAFQDIRQNLVLFSSRNMSHCPHFLHVQRLHPNHDQQSMKTLIASAPFVSLSRALGKIRWRWTLDCLVNPS
jgi:hypothetical protein